MSRLTRDEYQYPEGIEGALFAYLICDETGFQISRMITGLSSPVKPVGRTLKELLTSVGFDGLPADVDSDWRFMTRAEIRKYKEDEE